MNIKDLLNNGKLLIIAGPCVIETREIVMETAATLSEICGRLKLPFIFKSSYDKANRTSLKGYRGLGSQTIRCNADGTVCEINEFDARRDSMARGLEILGEVKKTLGLCITTDVHSKEEAKAAAEVVDLLQIPAFLCRQTDLLTTAASTGRAVNVKKGQFLAPWDVKNILSKLNSAGSGPFLLTERGTTFGYNNLVVDFRSIPIMSAFGCNVVFDATHSVQLPGGSGDRSSGQREFVPTLALAAAAAGASGLFLEVHPDPDNALCDGPNMLELKNVEALLSVCGDIYKTVSGYKNSLFKHSFV
ncbi:3-deoxy-8-phosphooctulonate synthase [Candidatus Magnetominusculus dajiuhuensis]|uniref:3-deoxy-8-phosphooctulonate synthase n=1 Tax=Candidatus Magnetominusculus dajiuhuensis TaxID=3137712 RepID=UPI003B43A3DF